MSSQALYNFISICIIANTIIMCLERYPISPFEDRLIRNTNHVFYAIFLTEVVLKFYALGFKFFLKVNFNRFDLFLIVLNTIEYIFERTLDDNLVQNFHVFSSLKILRLLKLVKTWKKLQIMLSNITSTIKDLRNFLILLLILMMVYTLFGLELFAYEMKFNEDLEFDLENGLSPRINFDGFYNTLIAVFNILQGEQWHYIMYDAVRSKGSFSILYFVTLVVLGNIILLKLFLAVLLENFEDKR